MSLHCTYERRLLFKDVEMEEQFLLFNNEMMQY